MENLYNLSLVPLKGSNMIFDNNIMPIANEIKSEKSKKEKQKKISKKEKSSKEGIIYVKNIKEKQVKGIINGSRLVVETPTNEIYKIKNKRNVIV